MQQLAAEQVGGRQELGAQGQIVIDEGLKLIGEVEIQPSVFHKGRQRGEVPLFQAGVIFENRREQHRQTEQGEEHNDIAGFEGFFHHAPPPQNRK